jgi:lipoyl(octanoyl) transferase
LSILKSEISLVTEFIGLTEYETALALMESTIAAGGGAGHIWGLEHPLVYTTGLKTESTHILNPNIPLRSARRGGSVTLHNPGQLVVYFAFPLNYINGGLERFVRVLEATIAETLISYGIVCNLQPGASGVFTPRGKIAFIGLGLKKNMIYHGISININNDMTDFREINSCGLTLPMTRLADLISNAPSPETVFESIVTALKERLVRIEPSGFRRRVEERYNLLDWQNGFRLGWLNFHERRYWEAHEIWEMHWHEMEAGALRIYFHAMIQVAMAWHKIFTVPNHAGAVSLLGKALQKLRVVAEIQLLQNEGEFRAFLEDRLTALLALPPATSAGDTPDAAFIPPILAWRESAIIAPWASEMSSV